MYPYGNAYGTSAYIDGSDAADGVDTFYDDEEDEDNG